MKYPAILKLSNECVVLATSLGCGFALKDYKDEYESTHVNKFYKDFHGFESAANITSEYLANTYGEVVSPEHAEFIIELGKNSGLKLSSNSRNFGRFFVTDSVNLVFMESESVAKLGRKKITIPLPPKQIQTATPEEEFKMTQIMKNAGDNLVLGCEDSKCYEWPKIGGEVTHPVCGLCKVISPTDSRGVVALLSEDGFNVLAFKSDLVKPKTPEEELRDELTESFCAAGYETGKYIDHLMSKYNITKKPQ